MLCTLLVTLVAPRASRAREGATFDKETPGLTGLRYVRAQYDTDACAGLGTAGGVCPVTLPCVQAPHTTRGLRHVARSCIVQPLDGLGFNLSIVLAPTSVRRQAAAVLNLSLSVHYVATHRFETNNKRVHCTNKWAKGAGAQPRSKDAQGGYTSTQLVLLGSRFEVLHRAHIYGGRDCTAGKCTLPQISQPPPKALAFASLSTRVAILSTHMQLLTCACACGSRQGVPWTRDCFGWANKGSGCHIPISGALAHAAATLRRASYLTSPRRPPRKRGSSRQAQRAGSMRRCGPGPSRAPVTGGCSRVTVIGG